MKTKMFTLGVILLLFTALNVNAKDDKEDWRYDIECAGSGQQGIYIVKVWGYSKSNKIETDLIKKFAVHGVLFKGYSSADKPGCTSQRPLAGSPSVYTEKEDFFNLFFDKGGDYLKYASIAHSTPEVVKLGKKEYKIGYVLTVSKDLLRSDLEKAGVLRGLGSGF